MRVLRCTKRGRLLTLCRGNINGSILRDSVVDTGSGYITINRGTFKTLKRRQELEFVKRLSAVMADGSEMVVTVYRLASLNIGGRCVIHDVEAAVFPGSTPNILGLSALKKAAPFTIFLTPRTLILTNCAHEGA